MSAPKYTPGPWEPTEIFELRGEGSAIDIQVVDGRRPGSAKNGGFIVARLFGTDMEGNAHLIAAAPELLTLLKDCKRYLESVEEGLPPGAPMPEQFEAAIAKTEGRK